ncbi:hypothetical protein SDC9_172383 [bioreactor metagenome]|uniref:Uncharacterized protein n=1 Tax=bioreactor metagenome TaxID=1076179 RepID=A0A645GFN4_9ZZZZ
MSNMNAGSVRREFRRSCYCCLHFIENVKATFLSLFKSFFQNISRNSSRFIVHLKSCYTFSSTSNFKVHISVVVFKSLNICENLYLVIFLNKSHCNSGYMFLYRNARTHKGKASSTNGRLRTGTIRFQNIRNQTNNVREINFFGNDRTQRSFCQSSMPNFTTTRSSHGANFSNRIRRKVIVKNKPFIRLVLF